MKEYRLIIYQVSGNIKVVTIKGDNLIDATVRSYEYIKLKHNKNNSKPSKVEILEISQIFSPPIKTWLEKN